MLGMFTTATTLVRRVIWMATTTPRTGQWWPRSGERLSQFRAALGVAHLCFPGMGIRVLGDERLDRRARRVVRILGARQVVQALATGAQPTAALLALGAEVDAAHAMSMVALGLFGRRWRHAALADALVAAALAALGAASARSGGRATAQPGVRGLLDRCADRLARRLVPGFVLGRAGPQER